MIASYGNIYQKIFWRRQIKSAKNFIDFSLSLSLSLSLSELLYFFFHMKIYLLPLNMWLMFTNKISNIYHSFKDSKWQKKTGHINWCFIICFKAFPMQTCIFFNFTDLVLHVHCKLVNIGRLIYIDNHRRIMC